MDGWEGRKRGMALFSDSMGRGVCNFLLHQGKRREAGENILKFQEKITENCEKTDEKIGKNCRKIIELSLIHIFRR